MVPAWGQRRLTGHCNDRSARSACGRATPTLPRRSTTSQMCTALPTRAPRQHRCIRSESIAHTDGHSYKKKKMFDRALEYYQRSLRIKEERMGR